MTEWHKWPENPERPPLNPATGASVLALVVAEDGVVNVGRLRTYPHVPDGIWYGQGGFKLWNVTHWAELPAPPECCIDCGGYNIEEQTCLDCQAKDMAEDEPKPVNPADICGLCGTNLARFGPSVGCPGCDPCTPDLPDMAEAS